MVIEELRDAVGIGRHRPVGGLRDHDGHVLHHGQLVAPVRSAQGDVAPVRHDHAADTRLVVLPDTVAAEVMENLTRGGFALGRRAGFAVSGVSRSAAIRFGSGGNLGDIVEAGLSHRTLRYCQRTVPNKSAAPAVLL